MMRATILAGLISAGCLAQTPCPEDDSETLSWLEVAADYDPVALNNGEAPLGSLVADAFASDIAAARLNADLAAVHAGAFSPHPGCNGRSGWTPGPITLEQVSQLLPFDAHVQVVEVSGANLRRAFEHGVAHLGDPGPFATTGQLLQVSSNVRYRVDCSGAPASAEASGSRISEVRVEGDLLDDGATYRITVPSTLAEGDFGFSALAAPVPNGAGSKDFVAVASYLRGRSSGVAPAVEGRIRGLASCRP